METHLNGVFPLLLSLHLSPCLSLSQIKEDFEKMLGSFFETPNALTISLLSTCLMTLASLIRNTSESSLCPLGVHFYYKQSMPLSCALALCHVNLVILGAHTILLCDGIQVKA